MVEKHRHCVICGLAVSPNKEPPICGKRCERTLQKKLKRERMLRFLLFIPLFVMIALLVLLPMMT